MCWRRRAAVTEHDPLRAMFGTLRSLLADPRAPTTRDRLVSLIDEAHALAPERYMEQWVPYIEASSFEWGEPARAFTHVEELRRERAKMPFATFTLTLQDQTMHADDLRAWRDEGLLKHLKALTLQVCGLRDEAVDVLREARMGALTHLNLRGNLLSAQSMEALARINQLRSLSVADNRINGSQLGLLAPDDFDLLDALDLGHNALRAQGITRLGPWLRHNPLRTLKLAHASLTDEGMTALHALELSGVRTLDLSGNYLSVRGAQTLTQSSLEPEHLSLATNFLGDMGARALAQWPGLSGVRTLDLTRNTLSTPGLTMLLDSPHLGPLHTLLLKENNFGDDGARLIAQHEALRGVQVLEVHDSALTHEGARALADSQTLPEHIRAGWARRVERGSF